MPESEVLVSEQIWDKFECLSPAGVESVWELGWEGGGGIAGKGWDPPPHPLLIRQHDCMWAGTCLSKEHARREAGGESQGGGGRRSLLRPQPPRPDTPQSEEESSAAAWEVTGQRPAPPPHDHGGYTKPPLRLEDLGVQTPSDSEEEEEEEIDVVSLGERKQEAVVRREESGPKREECVVKRKSGGRGRRSRRRGVGQHWGRRPESSSSGQEESGGGGGGERRSLHNNMERMRRVELRRAFEELRTLVPGLRSAGRAPKVAILKDAAAHCLGLEATSRSLESQVSHLLRRQQRLRHHLARLRRSLAASR